jgi:ribosomal protein S18 acetylase RimI-like enzyme
MDINVREAEERDFSQLVALFQEFAQFEKVPERMINSVEKMLREKEFFHCFVAENAANEIAGYVTYFFGYYTWVGKSLYMDDLYVRPQYRGQAIGTMLIDRVIALAKEAECYKLRWQVSAWNKPAIEFYRHLGAEIDGTEQNCDLIFAR